ncbi:efflux RND transporter permease subunit [Blastopirellula marina]|uniref:Multidrug resistance protein MexB-like n=1 Tax=Blastopirellula marina DSM 3645 TaxID=314230 RepID=A3ZPG9_9BACT|nr:efflux RND transporter permease subunit [Blastopirellula marina]EAQ81647.1 multidrug resistance protein MexB-like [Blastopirellula marina DSM 3645]
MFSKFLHRPALAIVISLLILFMGGLAITSLPISQFPSVAPPSVVVSVSFPGASAKILVNSTLVIMERAINGVPNMRYMTSAATSAGEASIMITFEPGTDPNVAVLNVNNRIQMIKNQLPPIVEREGIIVMQNMTSMLMYVNVYSKDPNHDQNFLYNYVSANLLPEIQRVRGVGRAKILGNRAYAMRVELDLDRMRAYNVSSADIMEMIKEQSIIGSPGRLGQATGTTSQTIEYVMTWVGRYDKPEQYADIILRENEKGEILRLKDVAKVSLGSSFYDLYSDIDGLPSASIVLKQTPGSNAADVIEQVKDLLKEFKAESFPPGMDYAVSYDVSSFLDASIEKVLHTLFEAFILVSLVVYLFLGDFRSTLIPTLAVPVSLIGTFFFMSMFGMSINLITLFALVLAIGVVVDDAIVVVEAVHAKMHEKHLSPYLATKEVVGEISGAIIAITLVMTSVFIPVCFMPGAVGVFYRQFALTMAMSIVLSGIVALTLTPVLCAMILKPHAKAGDKQTGLIGFVNRLIKRVAGPSANIVRLVLSALLGLAVGYGVYELLHVEFVHELVSEQLPLTQQRMMIIAGVIAVLAIFTFRSMFSGSEPGEAKKRGPLGIFLHYFDRGVEMVTGGYVGIVSLIVTRRLVTMIVIGAFSYGILVVNQVLPSGFIPLEDQGVIYGIIQTPPGSTLEYTNSKAHELQKICQGFEEVTSVTSLAGYEILTEGRGSNAGTCLINLKPWADRELTSKEIIERLEEKGQEIADVKLEFFEPPAVPGFGAAGGFSLCLLDKTNSGNYEAFGEVTENFLAELDKRKELKGIFTFFASNYPQYEIIIDNDVAMQKGVTIADAMDNLSIVVGSTWEQGFIRFGQFYKVYVQAAPEFRRYPEDLENMFVKNDEGEMVPYSSFMKLEKLQGMNEINRYNLYTTAIIQGAPANGYSSGQAIAAIQEVAEQTLPHGYGIGWQGLSYDEASKGNTAIYIFIVVVIFVYLVLVGQYESFLLPLAVLASLPVGLFGSFLMLKAMGLANDVYCQIGLVMLVGLLGKNAILIIEFAVQRRHEGLSLRDAAIEGGNLRFRPIVMTSFAFIAGLIPLVRATGPGAIGNRTIGTTAVGGMLMGTLIGVVVIPGLYYLFAKISDGKKLIRDEHDDPLSEILERHDGHGHSTDDDDSDEDESPEAESPAH